MAIHNGAIMLRGVSGIAPAKRGTMTRAFSVGEVLYGTKPYPVMTSVAVKPMLTSKTSKQGVLSPAFLIGGRERSLHNAPEYVVGPGGTSETIIEEVIVEVEKVYQPRRAPLEWFPEVWNGQKPKE